MMKKALRGLIHRLAASALAETTGISRRTLFLTGQQACRTTATVERVGHLSDIEFKVSSQFGEDGIIEWLVQRLPSIPRRLIEFGVEDYREANTRFLVENRNWSALVLDGSQANMDRLRADPIMWRHNLTPVCGFITRENINSLIADAGYDGDIGILSVDIDGMDYWVWEAINTVSPAIIICEYNAVLGDIHALTVPYRPDFRRGSAHFSHLYAGASIRALEALAERRGYKLVGSNSAGNNAFFVRSDLAPALLDRIADPSARPSHMREARNRDGHLSFVSGTDRSELISALPFLDVGTGATVTLAECGPLYSPAWLHQMGK